MKTLTHRLGYGLAFLVIIVSCSQPESEEPIIDTSRDVVEVSGEYMTDLMTAYRTFVENLSEEEKERLKIYTNTLTDRQGSNSGRTSVEAFCRCLAHQASCYARSNISECCICYDPRTQVALCGLYFGIAFCKLEDKESNEKAPSPPPTTPAVQVYPVQLKGLVDYIDRNNLGKTSNLSLSGLSNFKKLLSGL